MGFADQIRAFERKALEAANTSVCRVAEELFVETVLTTPTAPEAAWSKGLAINSWFPANDGFDSTVGSALDYSGGASLSRIKTTLALKPFLSKDGFVTLTNSVPYISRIEYLGWPTGQNETGWHWTGTVGPYSMVRTSVANIRGKYM